MQACQLCGAKSWGPINETQWDALQKNSGVIATSARAWKRDDFRRCDNCVAVARLSLIETAPAAGQYTSSFSSDGPLRLGRLPDFPFPSPADSVPSMLSGMKSILPQKDPETRTERLVHTLMSNDPSASLSQTPERYAQWVVTLACAIESELDAQTLPHSDTHPRNFKLDFAGPAMFNLSENESVRIGIALDCAIAYGALEHMAGNESLQDFAMVEAAYWGKVARLKVLAA